MKVDESNFICELDGYRYYLGDVIAEGVDWFTAKELVEDLGDAWELPNKGVAALAQYNCKEAMRAYLGWYWLADHHSSSSCFGQDASTGLQGLYSNEYPHKSFVRPVYKEKVKDNNTKIKLLRIRGYSDLVLDICGKKVLYELGNDPAISKGWDLSNHLYMLDVWGYEVVHEDLFEWLSQQQGGKNNSGGFKKVFHIREKNEDGEVLARGGATIVFVEDDVGFAAHIALCHPDDNYNKKVGVEVALGKNCYLKLPEVSDEFIRDTSTSYWKQVVKSVSHYF